MNAYSLVLEASRDERRIKVSVYERGGGMEGTLRPYEDSVVQWEQVESAASEITNLLNRANKRGKVSPEILQSLKKCGQLLFDLLIPGKAAEKLHSTTAQSLILYIDDKLVHIPWELLFNGREFLCRRFAMGRVVSTSQAPTALSKRPLQSPLEVLVLADPRQDLKASYREGVEIRDLLDQEQNDFEVDFKSYPVGIAYVKKNLRDYDIVHYAGHADYDAANPSEGGWLLTDGRLRAGEISAMGGLQPMPFLVFSNACQSGQSGEWRVQEGYGQQIFGLANAHLMAGVQHYIGTFWEILDEPSSYFAKQFYGFLAQGHQVGEAVRKARESLVEDFGEETVVWASYMLYGDPAFSFVGARDANASAKVAQAKAPLGWSQAMRSHSTAAPAAAKPRTTILPYAFLGALVVALGVTTFMFFSSESIPDEDSTVAASPAVTASLSTEAEPPAENSTKTAVETGEGQIAQAETRRIQERVKAEKPAPVDLSVPVAAFRETMAAKETTPPPLAEPEAEKRSTGAAKVQQVPERVAHKPPIQTDLAPGVAVPPATPPAKEPGQEMALKTGPSPVIAGPLTLNMNIIGQRKESDGSYTEVLVNEGSVLRSYDNFQVHLETNRAAYVYILIYDSQGRAGQLFPDPKIGQPGFVDGDRKIVVPAKDLWFWLDEHPGTETIYVLVSEKPMSDIRGLLAKMEKANEPAQRQISQAIKQRIRAMQRGVGGITKGPAGVYTLSDGRKVQRVTDVVSGSGAVVRAVGFEHR